MMDSDKKLILVVYADVRGYDKSDIAAYFAEVKHCVEDIFREDKNIRVIILPHEGDMRVECVNPTIVTDDEYAKASDVVDRMEKALHDFEKKNNNDKKITDYETSDEKRCWGEEI